MRHSGYIDIHCHVLPTVDDGARNIDDALEMLRQAQSDGISRIIATPHDERCDPVTLPTVVQELQGRASEAGIDVALALGSEVRFAADLVARHAAGSLLTLGDTQYLLLELPLAGEWSPFLADGLYELGVAGLIPVLAHAERYPTVQRDPMVLLDYIRAGTLVQVNADSLLGQAGRSARQAAEDLLHARMVHVIASDAHSPRSRPPRLSDGFARVEALVGSSEAQRIMDTAWCIGEGREITTPEPEPLPRRRTGMQRLLKAFRH